MKGGVFPALSADADAAEQKTVLTLPSNFGRSTGDWGEMVKRCHLRALVIYNRVGFYDDNQRQPDVPKSIAEDYNEACRVLADSAKASAALSRRCLRAKIVRKIIPN